MAAEWGMAGVRAICVSPGYTTFGMSAGIRLPPEVYRRIPSGRLVTASEVTEVVAFVLSSRAGSLTGIETPWTTVSVRTAGFDLHAGGPTLLDCAIVIQKSRRCVRH